MGQIKRVEDVYGVSNKIIETYIERQAIDDEFISGVKSSKHIIVYGSSKQGKTSLINKHLKEEEFVKVECAPETAPIDIYKSVLRQLGVKFQINETKTTSKGGGGEVSINASVSIPFIGKAQVGAKGEGQVSTETEQTYQSTDFNLNLAQDISEILSKYNFDKRIILENFHYLSDEAQECLAFDLRVFEDMNILFIILGIWREKNRLIQFNLMEICRIGLKKFQ